MGNYIIRSRYIPYSWEFSRVNILVDFVVSHRVGRLYIYKTMNFLPTNFDIIAILKPRRLTNHEFFPTNMID